jgi:uncharacterized protein YjiS (DUF1127 family)
MTTNAASWGAERPQSTGIFSTISRVVEAISRARSRRRTELILADLDDHALVDIGLNPGEVRRGTRALTDWVVQSHSGTARLIFVGR